jgi:hypothetical protein
MLVRHATPARNLNSILRGGLLCSKSQGRLPVVWVCSPTHSSWAVLHVIRRHGGRVAVGGAPKKYWCYGPPETMLDAYSRAYSPGRFIWMATASRRRYRLPTAQPTGDVG